MPDTLPLAQVAHEPAATLSVQPYPVWSALRTQLLGDEPDSECILRIRAMLTHLYATRAERMRGMHALLSASPAAFHVVARDCCGWSPEIEMTYGISSELAVIASTFAELGE